MTELNELLKHYKILLYWSEADEAYLAEMPELPGCMADGSTPEAAIASLYKVAALWVETALELGRPVPVPIHLAHLLEAVKGAQRAVEKSAPYSSVRKAPSEPSKPRLSKRKSSTARVR